MEEKLRLAIKTVEREATMRGFLFSPEKSAAIHFCRLLKAHDEPQLKLLEYGIPVKNEIKFFGLIFDKQLRWKAYIEY